jgi:hypothetical protein
MLKNIKDPKDIRETLLSLLATSGTLAGISLALVSIANYKIVSTRMGSIADDLFLFASLGFVSVCFFIFFALRRLHSGSARHWTNLIDILFLASLTLLILAGFVIVYTWL